MNIIKIKNGLEVKRSVLYSWVLSYICIIMFFFGIMLFLAIKFNQTVKSEINLSNYHILKQVQSNIDNISFNMQSLAEQVVVSDYILNFFADTSNLDVNKRYQITEIQKTLRSSQSAGAIFTINLYIQDWNMIITPTAITTPENFFEINFSHCDTSFEEWNKIFKNNHSNIFVPMRSDVEPVYNTVTFIKSLSLKNPNDLSKSIIVTVNESSMLQQFGELKNINGANLLVINSDNHVIATSFEHEEDYSFFPPAKNITSYQEFSSNNKESFITLNERSQYSKWYYLYIVPKDVYTSKLRILDAITRSSLMFGLLIGVSLIVFFVRKNYSPVKKLMGTLFTLGKVEGINTNEYAIIESAVDKVLKDSDKLLTQVDKMDVQIQKIYIEKLLKGRLFESSDKISLQLKRAGLQMETAKFAVIMFNIDEYFSFPDPESDGSNYYNIDEIQLIFKNIVEEVASDKYYAVVVETDHAPICLINIKTNEDSKTTRDSLEEIAKYCSSFIEDNFKIKSSIAISSIRTGIEEISTAYYEAIETFKYKYYLGMQDFIHYDDFVINTESQIYYPLMVEQQLIISIKSGETYKTKDIINDIINQNINEKNLTPELVKCLMFSLATTISRIISEMSVNDEVLNVLSSKPIETLVSSKSIEDFRSEVIYIASKIAEINKKNSESDNIVNRIIGYVNQNYPDINLTVSSIAEFFGLNPAYFSRLFKEQSGEGLLDYINRYRIDKSLEILRTTDEQIDAIALMVGFENTGSFRRVFKKYTGITPSKFRDSL